MSKIRNTRRILVRNPKGRDHFDHLGVAGEIMIKQIGYQINRCEDV
jgi:hypothetical protein